jgi:hypothetical protein
MAAQMSVPYGVTSTKAYELCGLPVPDTTAFVPFVWAYNNAELPESHPRTTKTIPKVSGLTIELFARSIMVPPRPQIEVRWAKSHPILRKSGTPALTIG